MNNNIDINALISTKLGFEAYFVLYCVYNKNKSLITQYTNQCKKINTDVFKSLEFDGYININVTSTDKIYYELISLTDSGKALLENTLPNKSEKEFDDFRKCYPHVVKSGLEIRRLHGDLTRCRNLYNKLLLETTHDILCKCAKTYHNEKITSNSEIYMQNLSTWLQQKNYLQYINNLENTIENIDQSADI